MSENIRINVRIDGREFNAEGPSAIVQLQYEQFLKAIAKPSAELQWSLPGPTLEAAFSKSIGARYRSPSSAVSQGLAGRPADYLLVWMYGALVFNKERDLSASDLIPILRRRFGSGNEERLDRTFAAHSGQIVKSGAKRGSRYGLTQTGVDYVETLIESIVGRKA